MTIKSYRPSNGTEGQLFEAKYCERCAKQGSFENGDSCQISDDAFTYEIDDSEYPYQWIIDPNTGKPTCTAFEPTQDAVRIELSGVGGDLVNYWLNQPMKQDKALTGALSAFEGTGE